MEKGKGELDLLLCSYQRAPPLSLYGANQPLLSPRPSTVTRNKLFFPFCLSSSASSWLCYSFFTIFSFSQYSRHLGPKISMYLCTPIHPKGIMRWVGLDRLQHIVLSCLNCVSWVEMCLPPF